MSDAEQFAAPAKRPRFETAQESYEAACKKYSSCEEHLRKLQAKLRQSSDLAAAFQKEKEEVSKDKRKRPKTKRKRPKP